MSYTKTTWVNNQAPAINADNLNHMEQGIESAHNQIDINTSDIDSLETQTQNNTQNIATETSTRQSQDSLLQSQIDQLVAPTGEAPTPAEIENARIGDDGVTYDTLGNAIRTQFSNVKSALNEMLIEVSATWSQGGISSQTGEASSSTTRLRTTYIPSSTIKVSINANYKFMVFAYSNGTFIGVWDGTQLKKSGTWHTTDVNLLSIGDYDFRLVMAKSNDATIAVSDSSNIHLSATINDSAMLERTVLSDTDNLNNITKMGAYQCTTASLPTNAPATTGGVLTVFYVDGAIEQTYYTSSAQYFRYKAKSGSWSNWQMVSTDNPIKAIFVENFTAEPSYNRSITVSWSRLYIKFRNGTTYNSTDYVTYTIKDAYPLLLWKNSAVSVSNSYGDVTADSHILLQYRDGAVVGGLLYPFFDSYVWSHEFKDDETLNVHNRTLQLGKVKWTPKANVRSGEGLNPAGVEVTGVPYSSVKEYLKFIGIDVSLHTFMTAINNVHSLMYTEKVGADDSASAYGRTYNGVNCNCYFGTVCSGITSTAIGSNVRYDSWQPRTATKFEVLENQDDRNFKVGDILSEDGHNAILTRISRHEDGRAKGLELDEHIAPIRFYTYNVAGLNERTMFPGGVWCRYKHLDMNTNYKASPFILIGAETLYSVGDFVYIDDENGRTFYRCKTANSDSSFTSANWEQASVYTERVHYTRAAIRYVQYGENLYHCIKEHTAGAEFDPNNWEQIKGIVEWTPYPFVYNDDIVTFAGDRACFRSNDLIYINYDENTSYTHMQLYKDGELIQTLALPASGYQIDVSSYCSSYGMYKARLTDGENYSAYTYFEVIDTNVSATYENGVVTINYSSVNGTPFDAQITEQSGYPLCNTELREDEIAKGQIVITPKARILKERYWDMGRYENYNKNIYARICFAGEYGNVVNEMILLGGFTPILNGELVYPNEPLDLGDISASTNVVLADRTNGNTFSFSFKANSGASVDVIPSVGTIRWINGLPNSLVNGTTYLVTITNGIGNVESIV